jgi:hypothetical protein
LERSPFLRRLLLAACCLSLSEDYWRESLEKN